MVSLFGSVDMKQRHVQTTLASWLGAPPRLYLEQHRTSDSEDGTVWPRRWGPGCCRTKRLYSGYDYQCRYHKFWEMRSGVRRFFHPIPSWPNWPITFNGLHLSHHRLTHDSLDSKDHIRSGCRNVSHQTTLGRSHNTTNLTLLPGGTT